MIPPRDVKEVQWYLAGMCKPLTELTHRNAVWSYCDHGSPGKAFKNATTLKLFNVNKSSMLQVDASDTGRGSAILQDCSTFSSSTLPSTEVTLFLLKKIFSHQSSVYEVLTVSLWQTRCCSICWSPERRVVCRYTVKSRFGSSYNLRPTKMWCFSVTRGYSRGPN